MNTVYIFFDNDKVRIPFTDYDKGLFNQLIKSRMGQWENDKQQYSILKTQYNADVIKSILVGNPIFRSKILDTKPPILYHNPIGGSFALRTVCGFYAKQTFIYTALCEGNYRIKNHHSGFIRNHFSTIIQKIQPKLQKVIIWGIRDTPAQKRRNRGFSLFPVHCSFVMV
jgi:hypothetical protein